MSNKIDATLRTAMNAFKPKLETLLSIWRELGHNENVIDERCDAVITHTESLLTDMVAEAESEKKAILDKIEKLLKKIYALRQRLLISGPMNGYEDTPFVLLANELTNKIKDYESELQFKMNYINTLLREEVKLCQAMGLTPKKIETKPLPTEEELRAFESYIDGMKQQLYELEEEFIQIKEDIIQMLADLSKTPVLEFEREIVTDGKDFILTHANMDRLRQWQNSLKSEIEERRGLVNELRQKLLSLWELIDESADYRSKFTTEIEGITDRTVRKLQDEISRCEELKKKHIKKFIDKCRKEIEELWEKCLFGDKQKSSFIALFKSEGYSEDLLMLHELQVEKLKLYYTNNKQIFDLLKKRDELWQRTNYLSEKASCPNRYKNRGGELLKEEKERKEINVQLPHVEHQILEELKAYKEQHKTDFLIDDKIVEEIIQENYSKFKAGQNAKLSAKKIARDVKTPCGKSVLKSTIPSPNPTGSKRKAMPLSCVQNRERTTPKRCKANPSRKTLPKIKLNDNTIEKVTYNVRRRLCSTKRLSKDGSSQKKKRLSNQMSPVSDDLYKRFKGGVTSRSSTFPTQKENHRKTPQKTPLKSPRTPRGQTRLQAASPLPLLF